MQPYENEKTDVALDAANVNKTWIMHRATVKDQYTKEYGAYKTERSSEGTLIKEIANKNACTTSMSNGSEQCQGGHCCEASLTPSCQLMTTEPRAAIQTKKVTSLSHCSHMTRPLQNLGAQLRHSLYCTLYNSLFKEQ
jgi:hypothetical protein